VTLNFSLELADGAIVDDAHANTACSFIMGDGSLLPYIEKQLIGKQQGDENSLNIAPENGFGQYNVLNIRRLPKSKFTEEQLELHQVIMFADKGQGNLPGVVSQLSDDWVDIDFNHPLSGKHLVFKYTILAVDNG